MSLCCVPCCSLPSNCCLLLSECTWLECPDKGFSRLECSHDMTHNSLMSHAKIWLGPGGSTDFVVVISQYGLIALRLSLAAGSSRQIGWQRVKEDTAWMWPLLKFLFGSASFLVWWAALVHWLPHMCSSRKQLWRHLRHAFASTCRLFCMLVSACQDRYTGLLTCSQLNFPMSCSAD